ncbi:MAG: glycosyltransferase [bacterium]
MYRVNIIIMTVVAALTISLWAFLNRPEKEPSWPDKIQGFSFSPMRANQDPFLGIMPTAKEISEDLALLAGKTHAVRTYTVDGVLAEVPALAHNYGINVSLGAWISQDLEKNEMEIEALIRIARESVNVVRVTVGNEAILRGDVPVELMIKYLDRVRAALTIPVSTAEPWHVWIKHPELGAHVDFIAAHMLPYWEGVHLDTAIDYVVERTNELKAAFPGKPIVLAEVGWPSNGRTRKSAVATESNEAIFLRQFLARAQKEKYTYYIMEAFDQPWKRTSEGAVGAYWGVYDVERRPKFAFTAPIVKIPEWHLLAGISVLVAAITFAILLTDSRTLSRRGRSFLAVVAYAAATAAVWIIYDYMNQYMTAVTVTVGILLAIGMVGVILILLTEAHEWAEALWVTGRRRAFTPAQPDMKDLPKVSIHLPTYNEPPAMVIETLNALAAQDYPDYEVLIIDNNTKDPGVWQPVEAHCQALGARFRFFHLDQLSGFKAGALNYALAHTARDASIVAVIDSDYMVAPSWLRDFVPQFSRASLAIAQAPQDYRDDRASIFKAMCYAEYKGFFHIGMVTRNERNAIIQHGTMTLVRRNVLEEVGGWAEWCITEDAELGLRIFEKGYEATYNPQGYGKGLMPDTFIDYKKQRFRWAYGAIQIMRRHARALLGFRKSSLTYGQRYHFIAGWLPWLGDGANLFFTFGALAWSAAMIIAPKLVDPPLVIFAVLPMSLFFFKVAKMIYLYRVKVGATVKQTFSAALAGLALSHTIAKAVIVGFATTREPFLRTPKMASAQVLIKAVAAVWEEFMLMLLLWMSAGTIAYMQGYDSRDIFLWTIVLIIQSVPYLASFIMSLISGLPGLPSDVINSPGAAKISAVSASANLK